MVQATMPRTGMYRLFGWVVGSLFGWVGDAQTGWVAKTGSLCVWGGGGGAGHNEETGMYRLKLEAPLIG